MLHAPQSGMLVARYAPALASQLGLSQVTPLSPLYQSHLSATCVTARLSAAAADVTSSRIVTYQLTGDTTLDEGEDCQFIQKMVLSLIEGTTLDEREDCQTDTLMLLLL